MRSLSRSTTPTRARPRARRRIRRTRIGLAIARWRRSSLVSLAVAMTAAGVAGLLTAQLLSSAAAARDRWGDVVDVDVVARGLRPGDVVTAEHLRSEARPRHLVPASALDAEAAVGRVAVAPIVEGEPVVAERVSSDLVPDGWRAIAIPPPATGAHPDVYPGDAIEVLDVGAPDVGSVNASEGIVVAVRERDSMVTVAVPRDAAGRVAYAAVAGSAVLALTAAPPPR